MEKENGVDHANAGMKEFWVETLGQPSDQARKLHGPYLSMSSNALDLRWPFSEYFNLQ